jgi:hypothetical protein
LNRTSTMSASLLAVGVLILGLAVPAHAEDEPSSDVVSVLSDITSESTSPITDVLENVAQVATDSVGDTAIDADIGGVNISVPTDPSDPVSLESSTGNVITIELPFADVAAKAEVVAEGVVSYDNNNSSITAPVVKDDGSLQVTTIIQDASAPTEYAYELTIPQGATASLADDGNVVFLGFDGTFVGGVTPAWAKDANGVSVPTHYVVVGTTLTQVVEHTGGDFAYPVVADPWLWTQLFNSFYRGSWHGDYTYNGTVTLGGAIILSGGGGIGGHALGVTVFLTAGWDEWKAKWAAITNKSTLRQQYECHVVGGIYTLPFTGPYNLERAQTNRPNWPVDVVRHHCNWTP